MNTQPDALSHVFGLILVAACSFSLNSQAGVAPEHRYSSIAMINAFHLLPPKPAEAEVKPAVNKPRVEAKLRGVTNMYGRNGARGFFEFNGVGVVVPKSVVAREGDRFDDIEVLKINVAEATAQLRINGDIVDLNLAKAESVPVQSPAPRAVIPFPPMPTRIPMPLTR